MKLVLILLAVCLLLLAACDRFEHDYSLGVVAPQTIAEFEDEFNTTLASLTSSQIDQLDEYFSTEFIHDNIELADIKTWVTRMLEKYPNGKLSYKQILVIVGREFIQEKRDFIIIITDGATSDRLEFIDCPVIFADNKWMFDGNKVFQNKTVFAQLFTGSWCSNCPTAEEKLHELKENNPDKFIYAEYHINPFPLNPLDIGAAAMLAYYGQGTNAPTAVFSGAQIYAGSGTVDNYTNTMNTQANEKAKIILNSLSATKDALAVSGSVDIFHNGAVNPSDLYLNYLLIADTISQYTNYAGDPLHQTVIAKGKQLLDFSLSSQTFSIPTDNLPIDYPNDAKVIVFVQTMHDTYNSETCIVHNVAQVSVSN